MFEITIGKVKVTAKDEKELKSKILLYSNKSYSENMKLYNDAIKKDVKEKETKEVIKETKNIDKN